MVRAAWPAAAAAAFAAAELGAGLAAGFFAWGRAEALLFFAFRPWLLLAAVLLAARFDWHSRIAFYLLALLTAGLSESLFLVGLGAADPWPEMLRGWAAGGGLVAVLDLAVQLGRRLRGRLGQSIAAASLVLLFLVPCGLRPYETVALGPTADRPATVRPTLLLMTGLPIIWGETGPFDPASRPAAFYRALQAGYEVRPLDHLDPGTLGAGRLMLLAQPRALAPVELVALDDWVRGGGRVLVLADPDLVWPSRLPLGDVRRPPPASLLGPLFAHWGLRLEPEQGRRLAVDHVVQDGHARRLVLAASGRFAVEGPACRRAGRDYLALCRIGNGRALLVADADLVRDELWTAPIARGGERHARTADNVAIVAHWLDRLGGIARAPRQRPVQWLLPGADRWRAPLLAALPILAALAAALALARFRRA